MTLVLALKGTDEVILAADSAGYTDHPGGMYRRKLRKLRKVNKGKWVVGIAGSDESLSLIETLNLRGFSFGQSAWACVPDYAHELWEEYRRGGFSLDMHFLLAGIDIRGPFMFQWSFDRPKPGRPVSLIGPSFCYGDHEAIGASIHGALYFAGEHHRKDMDTAQRVSLAHFCVSEAAKHDLRVGGPVDIAIANVNGVACSPESKLPGLRQRTESIAAQIRSILSAAGPEILPEVLPAPVRMRVRNPSGPQSRSTKNT
jgi:hypothetical protein